MNLLEQFSHWKALSSLSSISSSNSLRSLNISLFWSLAGPAADWAAGGQRLSDGTASLEQLLLLVTGGDGTGQLLSSATAAAGEDFRGWDSSNTLVSSTGAVQGSSSGSLISSLLEIL